MDLLNYLKTYLTNNNLGSDLTRQGLYTTINPYITKEYDYELIGNWLAESNLTFKSSPINWLKKALVNELEKGTFEKRESHCAIHPFLVVLKENNIKILENADCYLSVMFDYLINKNLISQAELVSANQKAIKYLANKDKTTDDFIALWKQSKLSKERNIDWELIDRLSQEQTEKWVKLLEELND